MIRVIFRIQRLLEKKIIVVTLIFVFVQKKVGRERNRDEPLPNINCSTQKIDFLKHIRENGKNHRGQVFSCRVAAILEEFRNCTQASGT